MFQSSTSDNSVDGSVLVDLSNVKVTGTLSVYVVFFFDLVE
jgi:hypothetical protein